MLLVPTGNVWQVMALVLFLDWRKAGPDTGTTSSEQVINRLSSRATLLARGHWHTNYLGHFQVNPPGDPFAAY